MGSAPVRTVLDPGLDTDHDGFTDAFEVQSGTDPTQASSHPHSPPDARTLSGGGGCASTGLDLWALPGLAIACAATRRRTFRWVEVVANQSVGTG